MIRVRAFLSFHTFFCNIEKYPLKISNIQKRKVELNITLQRVNNFDIKQKKVMEYLFYYINQAPNKKRGNANKAQTIPVTT